MIRSASLIAIVYTGALALWTIGQILMIDGRQLTGYDVMVLIVITQYLLLSAVVPWLTEANEALPIQACCPLIMTPWPLMLIAGEMSEVALSGVVLSQLGLFVVILLSAMITHRLVISDLDEQLRRTGMTLIQVIPVCVFWVTRETWLAWFVF